MPTAKDQPALVLGIMSGTSMDGVDYALCEIAPARARLLRHWHVNFPRRLRDPLLAAASNQATSHEIGQLHHDLGRFYARHSACDRKPRLVGLHGQTVFHHPDRHGPATLQLGEAAYLVESLRVPVVSNFRAADIAAGGQGAPLATLFHRIVFAKPGLHVCVNNLGGISNVTSLDWRGGRSPRLLAFDTGPANLLLDLAVRQITRGRKSFDRFGSWAARGRAAAGCLAEWLQHPFLRQPPPKSTGRELFGEPFFARAIRRMSKLSMNRPTPDPSEEGSRRRSASCQFPSWEGLGVGSWSQCMRKNEWDLSPYDALATLTEFTARSLALNYQLHLPSAPDEAILCGGGAANVHLVDRIRANLRASNPLTNVLTSEELGWPLPSVEPAAFALLAYFRWMRKAGNIPRTTGAHRAALLGQITGLVRVVRGPASGWGLIHVHWCSFVV